MKLEILSITFLSFLLLSQINGKSNTSDEDRAYEFGFRIEGMQHRHEKKDVNGIIQGEFGFITADGVYHVTVYATDENGNFKIISMKNIKISPPLDGSMDFSSSQVQVQKRTNVSPTVKPYTIGPTIKPACAGCGYVTTTKTPPNNRAQQPVNGFSDNSISQNSFQGKGDSKSSLSQNYSPQLQTKQALGISKEIQPPINNFNDKTTPPLTIVTSSENEPNKGVQLPAYSDAFSNPETVSKSDTSGHSSAITRKNLESSVKVSEGVIKIPNNADIPIKDKYPGMVDGLPPRINQEDIYDILYKFNWTVGYQGHYETGYKSGAKIGGYFVTGTDGISKVVTYVADEFGYRPKVKIVNLGLDSPDVPKDDKNFKLQSYEFVWYPLK